MTEKELNSIIRTVKQAEKLLRLYRMEIEGGWVDTATDTVGLLESVTDSLVAATRAVAS